MSTKCWKLRDEWNQTSEEGTLPHKFGLSIETKINLTPQFE